MSYSIDTAAATRKKTFTIALVGNPNCGKTSIFNGLVGGRAHVGNYPGVTVEKRSAKIKRDGMEIEFVDLPGCYSLSAMTLDERGGSFWPRQRVRYWIKQQVLQQERRRIELNPIMIIIV